MQNKPNFLRDKMNVTSFIAEAYENISNWTLGENKPNQTQFQIQQVPCEFFLSSTFLCPSYNLADYEQTWFEHGGEVPSALNPPAGCALGPRCPRRQGNCLKQMPVLKEGPRLAGTQSSDYGGKFCCLLEKLKKKLDWSCGICDNDWELCFLIKEK
ncbi:MAG: hypothetical protein JSW47_03895, partial [Phycisphaerales bacterium]